MKVLKLTKSQVLRIEKYCNDNHRKSYFSNDPQLAIDKDGFMIVGWDKFLRHYRGALRNATMRTLYENYAVEYSTIRFKEQR